MDAAPAGTVWGNQRYRAWEAAVPDRAQEGTA
jgi:hypothetical protein